MRKVSSQWGFTKKSIGLQVKSAVFYTTCNNSGSNGTGSIKNGGCGCGNSYDIPTSSSSSQAIRHNNNNNNNNNNSMSCLAGLRHPTELENYPLHSDDWRRAVCQLYRAILKLHVLRLLPVQRAFGDRFVRVEFERHVDAGERHARVFYAEWYMYAAQLEIGGSSGRPLTAEEERLLTPEQQQRLQELRSRVVQVRQTDPDFKL
ncbi:uncharacterized protein TM35_000301550 [Trypanosoma theileri]|uniref:Succinate dehydrogenase assembly factor 3 n=1 Tax=Trypanosoma theileri TaxID=67003 RepID=A0A1X0NN19_9TRYP|nr:uncharacterized protein TM35_000301550 [Trypanosoma theileri]ORC86115.1 hypothetical protein TM35_000301550 [Trypanosoma theileri]